MQTEQTYLDPKKNYRRICFTINNPTFNDCEACWKLGHNDKYCKYIIYAAEHADGEIGEDGHPLTPHIQGFVVLKIVCRPKKIEELLGGRAGLRAPQREDPSARCANYCKKEHFYFEFGSLKGSPSELSTKELRKLAIEWLDNEDNTYVRMKDIPAHLLMAPGFIPAWEARRRTLLGPDRDIKIITVIGPTACGKSYAAHNIFPDHAKWVPGNGGAWFSNGDAPVLLFEEFNGQIQLQKMLTLLDHYPLQLEYKGSMSPALFTTVVITSNVSPDHWYGNFLRTAKQQEECDRLGISIEEAERKWNEAKKALFDRIGFRSNKRGSGFYMEWNHSGLGDEMAETLQMRKEIWDWMESIATAATAEQAEQHAEEQQDEVATYMLEDLAEAAAAEPPTQLRRMDAEPDLTNWQSRIDALFN